MARPPRLERGTLCLEGRCSIQLSYGRTGLPITQYFARFRVKGKLVWTGGGPAVGSRFFIRRIRA